MGVRELWRLHGRKGTRELRVDFIALRTGNAPRRLDASEVLEGLTPDDVYEAVEVVRSSPNSTERIEAVARIVRRRRAGERAGAGGSDGVPRPSRRARPTSRLHQARQPTTMDEQEDTE